MRVEIMDKCKHDPKRLYSGVWFHPWLNKNLIWVGCCDCGEILTPDVPIPSTRKEWDEKYAKRYHKKSTNPFYG